jgi:hypothetical protein
MQNTYFFFLVWVGVYPFVDGMIPISHKFANTMELLCFVTYNFDTLRSSYSCISSNLTYHSAGSPVCWSNGRL